jgi:Uncharacterized protein conserved in bacteria
MPVIERVSDIQKSKKGLRRKNGVSVGIMKPAYTYTIPLYRKIIIASLFIITALSVITVATVLFLNSINGSSEASFSLPSLDELAPDVKADLLSGLIDPDREVRGVWVASVSNINFPSKQGLSGTQLKAELDDIVATCIAANLNAIYFQVRPTSDALYNSAIFPTSAWLTGVQGSGLQDNFDPLEYLIEIAHEKGIAVHAWINPLRVTVGSTASPQQDVTKLAANNPARLHPDWTVAYADGRLYYNPGVPEVRQLVADGITELVKNYDVDGVVFDDYFYPYPVSGATFNDTAQYTKYGTGFTSLADWRRDNINKLVQASYNAVKSVNPNVQFGVAPGGIWQNSKSTSSGSATNGFETYASLYADTLAWVKGGYVDYIAPQIYWSFTTTGANYDVLVRWWNAFMSQYPNVKLLISHGAYRTAEWNSGTEITEQVTYARSESAYRGSIMYGYAAIKANTLGLRDALAAIYTDNIIYTNLVPDGSVVTVTSPSSGSTTTYENTYIIGKCNPGYTLYLNGSPVSFTKSGYFSVYTALTVGTNTFKFTQNGFDTVFTITRKNATQASATSYTTLDKYTLTSISPAYDTAIGSGENLTVSAYAPSKSTVTATLGGQTITLKATILPPDTSTYMRELYTGTVTLPKAATWTITDLGSISITAKRGTESATVTGKNIKVMGYGAGFAVEVNTDDSELKISTSSWYYDDYTPQAIGMKDVAVRFENGYYKLRCGGWISASNVTVTRGATVPLASVTSTEITANTKYTYLNLGVNQNIPMNGYVKDGIFYLTLYNTSSDTSTAPTVKSDNLLFSSVTKSANAAKNTVTFALKLKDAKNFYGYEWDYTSGKATIKFRNPQSLASGSKPLTGKTILLDAGHGGTETGTTGPVPGKTEAYYNLQIVLATKTRLEELGATVLLTRNQDVTFKLSPDRLDFVNKTDPDLCVSVHQNAMDFDSDITRIRGTIAFYWQQSGKLLAECVSSTVSDAMGYYERSVTQQRLAMIRNPKFPSTLVEVAFLTSVEEVEKLNNGGIELAAQAIADGIIDYYEAQQVFINGNK